MSEPITAERLDSIIAKLQYVWSNTPHTGTAVAIEVAMRLICELRAENALLQSEADAAKFAAFEMGKTAAELNLDLAKCQEVNAGLADRVARQSELLSKKAEKAQRSRPGRRSGSRWTWGAGQHIGRINR